MATLIYFYFAIDKPYLLWYDRPIIKKEASTMSNSILDDIKDKSLEAQYWLNDYEQKHSIAPVQIDIALRQLDKIDTIIAHRHNNEGTYSYTYVPIEDRIDNIIDKVYQFAIHGITLTNSDVINLLNSLKEN